MITRVAVVMSATLTAGCIGGASKNANCEWLANHPTSALDLSVARDARHLADDAQTAEDLAIRHADASRGRASGRRDVEEYRAVREHCKASLYATIASQHRVPAAAVAEAVSDRREWLDALVLAGFAVLFVLVSGRVSAFILRGAVADSRVLAASMLFVAAVAAGGAGVLGGGLWFGLIESVRVGNGHMSYRVDRMPVRRHWQTVFSVGTILFATISAIQYRKTRS
jgi:hypothetical protein